MKIALFGATGGTGRQVLEQALEQGHRVTALARDPSKLAERDGLTVVPGDVLDRTAVDACIRGNDAAICVLGTRMGAEPIEARGTRVILGAMKAQGMRRLIAVTSMGVGDSRDQVPLFFKVISKLFLGRVMTAKEEQEREIVASDLDWTLVRPGGLTDGPRTGSYASGLDKGIVARQVARADVADFILKQLADDRYIRRAPAVA